MLKTLSMLKALVALMMVSSAFAANDAVVVLKDTVTGNQEQPKVLYIVPWQAADDDTILKQPLATQIHEDVFDHVERTEHNRELQYLQTLSGSGKDKSKK